MLRYTVLCEIDVLGDWSDSKPAPGLMSYFKDSLATPISNKKGATNFLISFCIENCVKGNAFLYHESIAAKSFCWLLTQWYSVRCVVDLVRVSTNMQHSITLMFFSTTRFNFHSHTFTILTCKISCWVWLYKFLKKGYPCNGFIFSSFVNC